MKWRSGSSKSDASWYERFGNAGRAGGGRGTPGAGCHRAQSQKNADVVVRFGVGEYLGAATTSSRPAQPDQWRRTQQQQLKRGEVKPVLAALTEHLEAAGTPEAEAPVRKGYRYLSNRLDCLDYPRALALGLPFGSGMIESSHRQVLQARLKKAGAAWLSGHADQTAHLRVLRANDQWLSPWN